MRADEDFKENGGQNFKAIPCLNDDKQWVDTMAKWINEWAATGKAIN